jgi:hypothetical protein
MAEFSFTNFLNNNGGNNNNAPTTRGGYSNDRQATPNQKKYYIDLCERKRIRPDDVNKFTFDQMANEIEKLRSMPDPASENQIKKIRELSEDIMKLDPTFKPMTEKFLGTLTGGRNGTATSLIQSLIDMSTQLNEIAPPSDAQLQIIVGWFPCPDIPFENFSIEKRVYLDKLSAYCSDTDNPEVLEKRAWRLVTPTEFAEQIKNKMTKREASKFIDDYQHVFYDWRKTRVTAQQVKYIRELESRLDDTYTPPQHEWVVEDGEVKQIQVNRTPRKSTYAPSGYVPLEEIQLAQMSFEEASEWIDRLKSEIARMNQYRTMNNEEEVFGDAQQTFHEKGMILQENRRARDLADAKLLEWTKFNDLIFAVEAIVGYKSDEIHDMVSELMMEDCDSSIMHDHKQRLKEFFMSSVTADPKRDESRWRSEMARIFNICEEVPTALEILAS